MAMVPVSLSPSTLRVNVLSMAPFGVSIDAFQVPEASANASRANTAIKKKMRRDFIVYFYAPSRTVSHFSPSSAINLH